MEFFVHIQLQLFCKDEIIIGVHVIKKTNDIKKKKQE